MSKKLNIEIEENNGKFEGAFTEYYVAPLNDDTHSAVNYNKIYNKPKLNGVTLVGNVSLDDIDVMSKEESRKVYSYDSIKKINEYLYELTYSKCDYEYARQYMETNFKDSDTNFSFGACSAVYKNGLFGKNFDWLYDNSISFIIKSNFGKYKSIGVSNSSIDGRLTKEIVESGDYSDAYVLLPYYMDSGINDQGLMVGVNVVPTGDHGTTTGTLSSGKLTCSMMLPTLILDNCATVEEAINLINTTNIFCPNNTKLTDEMHLFIGDKINQYIVEFIENEVKLIDVTNNYPWMTNYYRYGAEFDTDGTVNWESLTPHSNGVYRSNIIAAEYDSINSVNEMKELMNQALKYTNTYQTPYDWIDEFCYDYGEYGDLTLEKVYTHPEKATPIIDYFLTAYAQRDRNNPITWQSIHSCVYDVNNNTLNIVTQEGDTSYITKIETATTDNVWQPGTGLDSIRTKNTQANGNFSIAEGLSTSANSDYSHAEGWASRTIVDTTDVETHGHASHAEGSHTIAKGAASHAEGNTTESMGWYSHAEGSGSVSGGISSHAEGDGTVTNNYAEHAEGSYNKSNTSNNPEDNTLHSIGIGTSMADRKNAFEVMQNGDAYLLGVGSYEGDNYTDANTLQHVLATKQDSITAGDGFTLENNVLNYDSNVLSTVEYVDGELELKADKSTTYTKTEIDTALSGKADTSDIPTDLADLNSDSTHRTVTDAEKSTWDLKGTYSKPTGGIPKSDLVADVKTALDKADSALQADDLVPYRTSSAQDTIDSTKVDKITGKGLSTNDYTDADKAKVEASINNSVNNLINYYLKTETYTKTEVDNLVAVIKQFTYEIASVLPTASENTMHKIYLIPSEEQKTGNVKDEFITIDNGVSATTRYTWEQIGRGLPTVTSADNGKFLRVVDGLWTPQLIPNANGGSF